MFSWCLKWETWVWLSSRPRSVPVPCGLLVLHHSSQQSVVGFVGSPFRSTNVHGFIFGPGSLGIGVLRVPHSVGMLLGLTSPVRGMCSVTQPAQQSCCWGAWSTPAVFTWWFAKARGSVSSSCAGLRGALCLLTSCWERELSWSVFSALAAGGG